MNLSLYPEKLAWYEEDRYDNKAQARMMIRQFDNANSYTRNKYAGLKIECFNKSEADEIKAEISKLRPDVQVYCSWYVFGK